MTNSSGASVPATLTYDDALDTATWTPTASLTGSTTYTVTVSGAENGSGNPMSEPFSWSFTTTAAPPSVTTESPVNAATNVAVSTAVTATFSEAVQSSSINFTMTSSSGGSVAANVTYNSSTETVMLTPSAALGAGMTYTVTVSRAESNAGVAMTGPFTWSFTTAASALLSPAVTTQTPGPGTTGVAVSSPVTATFNEAVQPGTVTFTLRSSLGTLVEGDLSYNSTTNTETFTPSTALAFGTTYTSTVSGARDAAGDPMAGPLTWSFTTEPSPTLPVVTISSVQPALKKRRQVSQLVITFSGAINSGEAPLLRFYRLTIAGKHGSFTARNARPVRLRSAVYDPVHNSVTLTSSKPFSLATPLQLIIFGRPPSGLQDDSGRFIDGATNVVTILRRGRTAITQ
jgi:methionine-rich copper-binding protein CopC